MDDKFLYQLQETPDSEFVHHLHKKLAQKQPEPERMGLIRNFTQFIQHRRLVQVSAFLIIGLIAIMTISPAKAFVSSLITDISGQLFEISGDYPGDNYGGGEKIIQPQVMSLGEALAIFPYDINLPTNIPSGCVLDEGNVRVYVGDEAGPFANTIELTWISNNQSGFSLRISDQDPDNGEIVAPGSVEEISLNNNYPAVLIRGGWDADHKNWNYDLGYRLRWSMDSLTYDLMSTNREQLIAIAMSILK